MRIRLRPILCTTLILALMLHANAYAQNVTISSTVNSAPLVITASGGRFAGAISSITYRGQQYIDSYDHGRELQSASSFDGFGECFNPTEAGSEADGTGMTSSSVLQSISGYDGVISTKANMAFWMAPGQAYGKKCGWSTATVAQNKKVVSNHIFSKKVSIGLNGINNLISYTTHFYIPEGHASGAFEAATAYMPPSFNTFLSYDKNSKYLKHVDPSGWVTSAVPIIVSTANGASAMALLLGSSGSPHAYSHYEYHLFPGISSKQGCVFGEGNIAAGTNLEFSCPIAIGTVDQVIAAINAYPSASSDSDHPIYRFRFNNGHHFYTLSYSEGAGAGYLLDGPIWHTFSTKSGSRVQIFRCAAGNYRGDHFVSLSYDCEGNFKEGGIGYVSPGPAQGLVPLYRFYKPSIADHLITTIYKEGAENGYTFEFIVGYVPQK